MRKTFLMLPASPPLPSRTLRAHGPVLNNELAHREIPRIAGREPAAERERGGCYEAVRLRKRTAAANGLAPPLSGLPAFSRAQRNDSKALEERTSRAVLARLESANRLLDIDGARVRRVLRPAERSQAPARLGASAQQVDQDGRVEQNGCQLPDAALVGAPLLAHPLAGVLVPLVTAFGDRAERGLEQPPAVIIVQGALDRLRDVRASAASADTAVELADELVVERYVHSHGHTLAHKPVPEEVQKGRV
jgi:hypothetical protein